MPSAIRAYAFCNLLNLPAGIVPITKVNEQDDLGLKSMPNNELVRI
jgi:hypothetical protein